MENLDHHVNELATLMHKSGDVIKNLIVNQPLPSLQYINLDEIKKYLSYFKNKVGYSNISLQKNKKESVAQLQATLHAFRANSGPVKSPDRQQQQQQQRQQSLLPPLAVPALPNQQQLLRVQQMQQQLPVHTLAAADMLIINTPRKIAVYKILILAGLSPQTALIGVRDATQAEMDDVDLLVLNIMLKKSENSLDTDDDDGDDDDDFGDSDDDDDEDEDDNGDVDSDEQMQRRLKEKRRIRREKRRQRDLEDQELQEQEDKDMDAAILNSESERGFIAERKRQRIRDLRSLCSCSLGTAEEFKDSILAGAIGQNVTGVWAANHSASRAVEGSRISSMMTDLRFEKMSSESELIMSAIRLMDSRCCQLEQPTKTRKLDEAILPSQKIPTKSDESTSCSCSSSSSSSSSLANGYSNGSDDLGSSRKRAFDPQSCHCPVQVTKLRALLVRLLLLEKEAVKFFSDSSYGYLILLAKNLDLKIDKAAFEEQFKSLFGDELMLSAGEDSDNEVLARPEGGDLSVINALCVYLEAECVALETSIYAIPTEANTIPKIFRDALPVGYVPTPFSLEDDGFEIC
jgi:hypothetical protein